MFVLVLNYAGGYCVCFCWLIMQEGNVFVLLVNYTGGYCVDVISL